MKTDQKRNNSSKLNSGIFHYALETFSQLPHYVMYLLKWLGCQNKQTGRKRERENPKKQSENNQKKEEKEATWLLNNGQVQIMQNYFQ